MDAAVAKFAEVFALWKITIPPAHVRQRQRGKIIEGGWTIWYLFGRDAQGEYLDYYACHRMTNDRHVRLYEDGTEQMLEALMDMRVCAEDPAEDARLEAEFVAKNRQIAQDLHAKGFLLRGD